MQNLYNDLEKLLKDKAEFVVNGKLNKSKISDAAYQYNEALLKILLSQSSLKKQFFMEVGGATVFKQREFLNFLKNKDFLPNSFTEFKNQIGLQDEKGEYYRENKDIVLVFPYKDCILEGGQDKEDQKRNEIFYNETLAPDEITRLFDTKALTNFKLYDSKGEHVLNAKTDIDFSKQNLILKGNNLLALHSLKGIKSVAGQVKLIYIDPPYNTGSDSFNYNDKFNHSTWLTFMKNRLEIAKNLLTKDGILFLQIDIRELAYIKVLLDEIFGAKNFIGQINWQRVPEGRTLLGQGESDLKISTEYLLVYAKNKKKGLLNSDVKKKVDATDKIIEQYKSELKLTSEPEFIEELKDENSNPVKIYKVKSYELKSISNQSIESFLEKYDNLVQSVGVQEESSFQQKLIEATKKHKTLCIAEYSPTRGKRKGKIVKDYFLGDRKLIFAKDYSVFENNKLFRLSDINDFWSNSEIQVTGISDEGGVTLRRGKKPEGLLKRIIELATEENDLVLDFHLGSGTTAAVAHKMNRRYIGVEQLDYERNGSVTRLKNVIDGDKSGISTDDDVNWKGGGSFVYAELKRYNQQYIDDIEAAKDSKALKKLYEQMKEEAFFRIEIDHKKWNNGEFEKLTLEEQKQLLCDCLDKNHLYVNLTEMEDAFYKMSKDEIALNKKFYNIS